MPDEARDSGEYVGSYDKLVRDDIPAIVEANGNHPVTRRVDGVEYERYLAAKLREEATEVADAIASATDDSNDVSNGQHDDDVLDELADVHTVLEALVASSDHPMDAVLDRAREKATDRGGFEDGVVLERIESTSGTEQREDT